MTTTPLPPLPDLRGGISKHTILGELYDRLQVEQRMVAYATQARADLEAEIQRLRDHMEAIEQWKAEGEQFFGDPQKTGVLFQIAVWWADRPWRARAALEFQK